MPDRKAGVGEADLQERFGSPITQLVPAVSDDCRIRGCATRKAALRRQVANPGPEALALFAADKLSKLRELHRETALGPDSVGTPGRVRELRSRRLKHYQRSLALLEERLPDSPLVRELRHELGVFVRVPVVLASD